MNKPLHINWSSTPVRQCLIKWNTFPGILKQWLKFSEAALSFNLNHDPPLSIKHGQWCDQHKQYTSHERQPTHNVVCTACRVPALPLPRNLGLRGSHSVTLAVTWIPSKFHSLTWCGQCIPAMWTIIFEWNEPGLMSTTKSYAMLSLLPSFCCIQSKDNAPARLNTQTLSLPYLGFSKGHHLSPLPLLNINH